jgi:AcrR family transcriptional regulator
VVNPVVDAHVEPEQARGRPRDRAVDQAVLEALIELVSERGYAGTTMDLIAERAGVAKTTIYRRWPSRDALILEAVHALKLPRVPEDTGALESDLIAELEGVYAATGEPHIARFMQATVGEMLANEELARLFRAHLLEQRAGKGHEIFRRAAARGEIPSDLDCSLYVNLMAGSTMLRVLLLGERPQSGDAEAYARAILDAITAECARRGHA